MEDWSIRYNKTRFLPSCSFVTTTVWMHHTLKKNVSRKILLLTTQQCYELSWTNSGNNFPKEKTNKQTAVCPLTSRIKHKVRRTNHTVQSWRSKFELISDTLQWTTTHCRPGVSWPTRNYFDQLFADTECSL